MLETRRSVDLEEAADEAGTRTSVAEIQPARTRQQAGDAEETGGKGLSVRRVFSTEGREPVRPGGVGAAQGRDHGRQGAGHLRAGQRGGPASPGRCWPPTWWPRSISTATSGTPEREYSVRQLVHRVARTIADWGMADGYFARREDAEVFYDELAWLCLNQYGAFNSPVWFNCGLYHQYGVGKNSGAGQLLLRPEDAGEVQRAATPVRVSAVLGLLHPVGGRHDGRHHGAGPQRGDALQVRQRHRHGPVHAPQLAREAERRRAAQRARCPSSRSTTPSPAW